jgi:glutathione synthase/RimK-type ligase-like ATP-grasp enzyme
VRRAALSDRQRILILGPPSDAHAAAVHRELLLRGARPVYLDLGAYPVGACFSWDFLRGQGRAVLPGSGAGDEVTVDLAEVRGVYLRVLNPPRVPAGLRQDLHSFAAREARHALEAFLADLRCPVVNPLAAVHAHRHKPRQSAQVARLGVAVPATLISNDPAEVRRFCAEHAAAPGGIVVKPVLGGAYARRLSPADLGRERSIRACPMQYQVYVPGEDVRAYVVGEEVFAGRIVPGPGPEAHGGVDFRTDPGHRSEALRLSRGEEAACVAIARTLGLRLAGIDFRRAPDGRLIFLEANPSPMFLRFAQDTGHPVLERLMDLILSGPS